MKFLVDLLGNRRFALISLALLFAVIQVYFLSMEKRVAGEYGFSLDDSWIHAVFAKNLVERYEWSFNPGEPISASTAPLYTIILAAFYAVTGNMLWSAKLFGIACLAGTAWLVYLVVLRLTAPPNPSPLRQEGMIAAWFAALLIIASPRLVWASQSGMEMGLFLFIAATSMYFFVVQKYRWMTVMLALSVWVRPECVLLLAIGWLAIPKREKLRTLAIGTAIMIPYFAMNYALGDYPFPLTVKTKGTVYVKHFSGYFLAESAALFTRPHFFPIFLLAIFGAIARWRRTWWIVAFPLAFYVMLWSNSGTAASFHRYLFPMLPFLFVLSAMGVGWMFSQPKYAKWAAPAALIIAVVQIGFCFRDAPLNALSVKNINDMQVQLGRVVPALLNPDEKIGTNDVGAVGYFGQRYLVDFIGLVTPLKTFEDNIYEHRPALVAIFDSWFPDRFQSESFMLNYSELVRLGLADNVVCGDSVMTIYARRDRYDDINQRLQKAVEVQQGQGP